MEMKKSNVIYLGAAFVLGMLILGGSLVLMVNNLKSYDRCVTVKGLCEKEVMADKVIWPIMYKQGGNELGELYNTVEDMNATIVKFLKDAGVSDDEITMNAPSILDTRTNLYGERKEYHYIVTAGVTVCSEKVGLIVKLQTEQAKLYEKGIKKKDIENNAKRILGLETKKFKSHLSSVLSQASVDLAKKNALEQLENNRELHDRYINEAIDEIDRIGL